MADTLDREMDEMLEKLQAMDDIHRGKKSHIVIHYGDDRPEGAESRIHIQGLEQDHTETGNIENIDGVPVGRPGGSRRRDSRRGTNRQGTRRTGRFSQILIDMDRERLLTIVLSVVTVIMLILIIANFEAISTILLAVFLFLAVNFLKIIIVVGLIAIVVLRVRFRTRRWRRWGIW